MNSKLTLKNSLLSLCCTVFASSTIADVVHSDDVIIESSACIGFDCVNGESFGFDTLRLKENNLRIHFDDTSTSASFPRNDWRIIINDTDNGGASYFAIGDATSDRVPFMVEAGARNDALRIDSSGRVGFGTANPVVELHSVDGDSPTLRLEQNGSSGFTPQSWDVAGNETNFFIRDATNGSTLPFRIRPNSPSNSLYIAPEGVNINKADTPQAQLDVNGDMYVNGGNSALGKLHVYEDGTSNITTVDIDGDLLVSGRATLSGVVATENHDNIDTTISELTSENTALKGRLDAAEALNQDLATRVQAIEDLLGL